MKEIDRITSVVNEGAHVVKISDIQRHRVKENETHGLTSVVYGFVAYLLYPASCRTPFFSSCSYPEA